MSLLFSWKINFCRLLIKVIRKDCLNYHQSPVIKTNRKTYDTLISRTFFLSPVEQNCINLHSSLMKLKKSWKKTYQRFSLLWLSYFAINKQNSQTLDVQISYSHEDDRETTTTVRV